MVNKKKSYNSAQYYRDNADKINLDNPKIKNYLDKIFNAIEKASIDGKYVCSVSASKLYFDEKYRKFVEYYLTKNGFEFMYEDGKRSYYDLTICWNSNI